MNIVKGLLVTVCALSLAAVPAFAEKKAETQPAAKKEKAAKAPTLRGIQAGYANRAGLDDGQREQIAAAYIANKETMSTISPKIVASREKVKAARDSKDEAAIATAVAEQKLVNSEREAADLALAKTIRSILKGDQVAKWEAAQTYYSVTRRLSKVELTDDQKSKIDSMVDEAGKKIAALDIADSRGARTIQAEVYNDAVKNVLTDAQRAELTKKPEKDDAKDKASKKKDKSDAGEE